MTGVPLDFVIATHLADLQISFIWLVHPTDLARGLVVVLDKVPERITLRVIFGADLMVE